MLLDTASPLSSSQLMDATLGLIVLLEMQASPDCPKDKKL